MSSLLLDTNLFVLLVVGTYDKNMIGKHKRTRSFIVRDYEELIGIIKNYKEIWVTSHCLAEISNLVMQTEKKRIRAIMSVFSSIIHQVRESHIPKNVLFDNDMLLRLGVADAGLLIKSKRVHTVITTDMELYLEMQKYKGINVINWNHISQRYYLGG